MSISDRHMLITCALSRLRLILAIKSLLFHLKSSFFFLDILKVLFCPYGNVGKRQMSKGKCQNKRRHKLNNKQLQYTCYQTSQEVKVIKQLNLLS